MPLHLFAPESAARRSKIEKKALVSEVERLAVGTGGLLLILRAVEQETLEGVVPVADSGR